jgi:hypothetical protein
MRVQTKEERQKHEQPKGKNCSPFLGEHPFPRPKIVDHHDGKEKKYPDEVNRIETGLT